MAKLCDLNYIKKITLWHGEGAVQSQNGNRDTRCCSDLGEMMMTWTKVLTVEVVR